MISSIRKLQVLLTVAAMPLPCALAQKVKVGYDKSVDFSRYQSYTLQELATPPSGRPILYITVAGSIRAEIEAKGLVSREKDGDLTVIANGGLDYGLKSAAGFTSDTCKNCTAPMADPREWTGKTAPPGNSGKALPDGVLELDFVDRASNKVVWSGTVEQRLDPNKPQQSLNRVNPAIKKLLMEFPPKGK